ncbi:MAG TPA: nucleotide disphospho-sugar-binding domain-containing protein [Solirubrobacteraceae bacterium]|jgi:UDP:flavonoid glycosyltransferase YjiC (YdhE family)
MRVFQTLLAFSGNAPPQLALTRRLVERGHEVKVLAHRAARERIEATGAEFVEFKRAQPEMDMTRRESDPLRDWEARTRFGAGQRVRKNLLVGLLLDTSRECAELLKCWPAEVVVLDWMLPGAAVAAEGAGVPAVALVHCPFPLPIEGAPLLGNGLRPMGGWLGAVRDGVARRVYRRVFAAGVPALNEARAEQGLRPVGDWDAQLLGVEAIYVMTAPELDFSSEGKLPPNVHYVGPAFEPFAGEWRSPWPESNADPLVLISFSTSYMNQRAPVQRVLDAVAALPVRALLTSGPALDSATLRIPANARTVTFLPHRLVLPDAALMITHAGWQTVNAALADGVPLLCVPGGRDQPDNAVRVVRAGAGMRVRGSASPRKLRKAIVAALKDPSLRRGAGVMAKALARSDGADEMAQRIERLGAA